MLYKILGDCEEPELIAARAIQRAVDFLLSLPEPADTTGHDFDAMSSTCRGCGMTEVDVMEGFDFVCVPHTALHNFGRSFAGKDDPVRCLFG